MFTKVKEKQLQYLDTLELTSDLFRSKTHETYYRRSIAKHKNITKLISILTVLRNENTKKKYWKTFHCNRVLLQEGLLLKGSLCRKRWCTHCSRIRIAELTNGYKQPLLDLGKLYFVTLTAPTVQARELKSEIRKRITAFQKIKDNLRKAHKIKLNGIRKLEVTYNQETNKYHPHFHFILSDLNDCNRLISLWLNYFPNANKKGQHSIIINTENENSFIELFKYATKETTKKGVQYAPEVLHTIYSALEGFRIYQTFGKIRKVKRPKKAINEVNEVDFISEKNEIWLFDYNEIDYTDSKGEFLIDVQNIKAKKTWHEHEAKIQNTKQLLSE
jgi:hypothetical protein